MDAISMQDSLTMLVGAACLAYSSSNGGSFVDFALCERWQRRGALFLASRSSHGQVNGIHGKHAYSVLQVNSPQQPSPRHQLQRLQLTTDFQFVSYRGELLVKLRNPWGRDVWTGQWSPTSERYRRASDELLAILDMKRSGDKDFTHGEFVMAWADFVAMYDHLCLAVVKPQGWAQAVVTGRWPTAPRLLQYFRTFSGINNMTCYAALTTAARMLRRAVLARGVCCSCSTFCQSVEVERLARLRRIVKSSCS
jgi:hypothetical protein